MPSGVGEMNMNSVALLKPPKEEKSNNRPPQLALKRNFTVTALGHIGGAFGVATIASILLRYSHSHTGFVQM